eukprot:TRINITY_DN19960_c0_g1_i1.p1 TRINITY_DN19960_c0_g1~~TRINITY_DN19960_c0_g1_i1.p1  ORF type:complete len:544 (+),score=199.89 TRINITY_DN19960_c0_g1_i1:54-1685(+)
MRRTCLFFAAAALLIAAPSHASDDILLKPDHTAGIPVGVVAVEGAEIPNQGYVPLMQALQRAAAPEYSVWVALPAFLLDTPNPLQLSGKVDSARQALFAAMPNATAATKVVGFAHSLGAVFLQDHVFQNAGHFSAQFLTGASLGRKYRSKPYPVPTMALDGTLDGLYRLTRQAEAYFHMEDPAAFPVVTFEGVTHMQFASGAPPSNVAKNDLKPEVTYEAAHGMIAAAMANFMRAQLGGGGVDRAAARAAVAADVKATGVLMGPLVAALRQEGYHHFAAACNSDYQLPAACPAYPRYPSNSVERKPQDASCTCGVPFTADVAQVLMGTASASPAFPKDVTIKAADAVHAVSEITPIHLPHIWSTCSGGGGPCTLNVTTVTQPVYATLDPLDTGFYYQSASELKTKLKSRQALLLAAGVPEDAVNFTETDTEGRNCAVINNASYQWALQHAGETARARYERIGQPLEMGEDIFLSNVGPVWIYNSLKYEEAADRSKVVVRAPSSHTPVDYPIKSAAGYHYCKVLSPARAMEWIYIDGLRRKGGL